MRRRFCKIKGSDRIRVIERTLPEWGYPRKITAYERGHTTSKWYAYGDDSLFWIERVVGEWWTGILHVAVKPTSRKRHGTDSRKLFNCIDFVADLMKLDRLIANDCTESGEVTDYLKRLGWTPCVMETIEGEWYEKRFVDGDEARDEQAPETEDRPTV